MPAALVPNSPGSFNSTLPRPGCRNKANLMADHDPVVRRDHNRLFEHLLWIQYKCKEESGGSLHQWDRWTIHGVDMVTACIKIAQDHFKHHFLDTRGTRKMLQSLLENFESRLSRKVCKDLKIRPQRPDLVAPQQEDVQILPQPGPSMQVVRDSTMSLVTLNTTADRSDSSLNVTPSLLMT